MVVGMQLHGGVYSVLQPDGLHYPSDRIATDDIGMDYGDSLGAGARLDLAFPFARWLSFHLQPGFFMGRGSVYHGDAQPSGYLWVADLAVSFGVRLGPVFFEVGTTLGLSRGRRVELLKDDLVWTGSFYTFAGGLVLSRKRDIRVGIKTLVFPSYGFTAYIGWPLVRAERSRERPSTPPAG